VGLVCEWHGLTSGTVFRQRKDKSATCCLRCLERIMTGDDPRSFDQTNFSYPVDQRCSNMNSHPVIIEPVAWEWQAWSAHNTME
jgi:hypothetical protein